MKSMQFTRPEALYILLCIARKSGGTVKKGNDTNPNYWHKVHTLDSGSLVKVISFGGLHTLEVYDDELERSFRYTLTDSDKNSTSKLYDNEARIFLALNDQLNINIPLNHDRTGLAVKISGDTIEALLPLNTHPFNTGLSESEINGVVVHAAKFVKEKYLVR